MIDPVTGAVNRLPAITSGAAPHQIAVVEDLAAVPSPTTGEVVRVNLANGSVNRRISVGGAPARLALLGVQRSGQYAAIR